jgi:hypothetical protein
MTRPGFDTRAAAMVIDVEFLRVKKYAAYNI